MTIPESIFTTLDSEDSLSRLVGTSEDAYFECKEWRDRDQRSLRESLVKAVCGFANAGGGVLLVGVQASRETGQDFDVVRSLRPFHDAEGVRSLLLDFILQGLEPAVEGVEAKVIASVQESRGYVIVLVPRSDGLPVRSRHDSKFYVRMSSGTIPMEYFQIADRFGRRPLPRLVPRVGLDQGRNTLMAPGQVERMVRLDIENQGAGMGRFPALSLPNDTGLNLSNHIYASDTPRWPFTSGADGALMLRGGSNDVIYPGETINVGVFLAYGQNLEGLTYDQLAQNHWQRKLSVHWTFPAISFKVSVACEGMAMTYHELHLGELIHHVTY